MPVQQTVLGRMMSVGDLAAQAAAELQDEHLSRLEADGRVVNHGDYDDVMTHEKRRGPFSKITFRWRDSDQMILEQIRAGANRAFEEMFLDAVEVVDRLYEEVRVPKVNSRGVTVLDDGGRIVWETDQHGNYVENWDNLTGQDVERALLDIARLRLYLGKQVNELLMEALFAKRIYTDRRDDEYTSMIDGTIDDKTAKANRKSRQDNYRAFFSYWVWSQGDVFLRELGNFQRVLERIRDRRIYGDK